MDPGRNRRAAFALPLSMLAVGPTPAQAAGVECSVDYRTNDWGSGFTVDLTLANRGTDAINGWTVTFGYTGNQKLVNGPNGTWSQSGQTVTVQNASYNATIAAGAAVTAGAQFGCSGTNAAPTPFAVNGTPCNGAHQPPMTVLPSPKPGAVYTKGDPVPLAATAAAADNATISKVEFYDDTTLLGTDTTAPYSLSASDLTVGSHSLVAKAYDSLGASGESTPVGVTVAAGPALVLSPSQLAVQPGKSGTLSVKLSTQPASNVSVERTSGNTGLSVTSGSSLTLTPSNWNTAQQVTVTADSTGTGAATFTASATGYAKAAVTVTELAASKTYDALLSWYYAWGGAADTSAGWAWRIGSSHAHSGYQNPLAAYALSSYADLKPKSATGAGDWSKSLQRQIEFYRWLQSDEGAIAGGATNSWQGRYATAPSGTSAFYGMYYDEKPVYHDPSSNQWFGFQAWSMERVAELYQQTGNAQAKQVLDKWVKWALSKPTINPDGACQIPSTLQWSGKTDTWNASSPGANSGLHVTVADYTNDVGVAAAYAKTLASYGAKSGYATAKSTAKALLDGVPSGWTGTMPNRDAINSSSTFLSLRSFYKNDPAWSKIEAYLKGGAAPVFTYHRFWVQADIALAMGSYAELLE